MADEDEESYTPDAAIINAVRASQPTAPVAPAGDQPSSGLRTGGLTTGAVVATTQDVARVLPPTYGRGSRLAQAQAKDALTASHYAAMESIERAKLALEGSAKYYQNAKTYNAMVQQAKDQNDAAHFLVAHAPLDPSAPDYAANVNKLAARFPRAASNDAVKTILSNPKLAQEAILKGDLPGEVSTLKAIRAGWIKSDDLNNPALLDQNGNLNHAAITNLASTREGQAVESPDVKQARIGLSELMKQGTDLSQDQEALKTIWTTRVRQAEEAKNKALGVVAPPQTTTASLFPRANAAPAPTLPAPTAPGAQVSIPKAAPPPTPAPTPMSPTDARDYLDAINRPNE